MINLRAFIFGSVMHLYWSYQQKTNYAFVNNILKVKNFEENSHFALFSSFGLYAKDTKFINGTHTTHRNIDTHRHMHRQTDTDTIFTVYTF